MAIRQSWQRVIALLLVLALSACSVLPRPTAPPAGAPVEQAWGAIPPAAQTDKAFSNSLVDSLRDRFLRERAATASSKIPYRALTLSGGGSRGAYGAGVLSGWTERGDRPQFDVVTGISTGALMATHVFLGSEFDKDLEIYKNISNDDVFGERGILAALRSALRSAAAYDTSPLRQTLLTIISEETLDLVAAEYRKGRRLFVGTTNLDANLFTIWDMGLIAESDRPDRLDHFIDVVMASAAFPLAFPPMYIEVEGEAGTYTQMHADGGIRETVFFFDFIEELKLAVDAAGLQVSDFKLDLYLLINGPIASAGPKTYTPVEGSLGSVVDATISSLMTKVTQGSLYRLWVLAMIDGADIHISYIPPDFEFTSGSLTFDPSEQALLFDLGYQQATDGNAWATQRAPINNEELLQLILDPTSRFDSHELPDWLNRDTD
jgi:hypothetical protein